MLLKIPSNFSMCVEALKVGFMFSHDPTEEGRSLQGSHEAGLDRPVPRGDGDQGAGYTSALFGVMWSCLLV